MAQIHVLSPHVADLIAAGEVVDRPASVVKELMENSMDAKARTVVVEIRSGGREYIRITDDGCGMAPEDAGVCFLRHATSKLHDERGLEAIGTMGFRGEALAAISAVSHVTLTTRQRGAASGVCVDVLAGEIQSMEEIGCPEGTTIVVEQLFYNTPARLKFMGSDRAEGSACVQAALRSALGRPDVSFRCIKDGEEQFFSPGDGQAKSAVYALLGREFSSGLMDVSTEADGVAVSGFVSAPGFCRGNRSAQYFFCNGRPIRSKTLQAALEQAYKNAAMIGRFPACVLYIQLAAGLVDVNVHPTKAEVKFAREKAVFDGVYYGALAALGLGDAPKAAAPAIEKNAVSAPAATASAVSRADAPAPSRPDFFREMGSAAFRKAASSWEKAAAPTSSSGHSRAEGAGKSYHAPRPVDIPFASPSPVFPVQEENRNYASSEDGPAPGKETTPIPEQLSLSGGINLEQFRFVGETMNLYVLLEKEDTLYIIDKHAAHERILFDKMRLNEKPLMSQELLVSETFTTDGEGAELLSANAQLLARLGYELEPFGDCSFVLRAVPADISLSAAIPLLEEITEKLREGRRLSAADVWERLAATVACKAAIKAGSSSDPAELMALAGRVLSGEVKCCPHGRPVMTVISRAELDKRFGRIV